jgi:hypothetical protein
MIFGSYWETCQLVSAVLVTITDSWDIRLDSHREFDKMVSRIKELFFFGTLKIALFTNLRTSQREPISLRMEDNGDGLGRKVLYNVTNYLITSDHQLYMLRHWRLRSDC